MTRILALAMPAWGRWAVLLAAAAVLYGTGRIHQARIDEDKQLERDHQRMQANVDRLVRRAAVARRVSAAYELDKTVIDNHHRAPAQRVTHAIETRTVYRDCVLEPDVVRDLNAILAGSPAGDTPGQPPDVLRPAPSDR